MLSIRKKKKKKRSGVLPSARLAEPVGGNPQQREMFTAVP